MSEAATKLVEALLQLPESDRLAAAGLLWESLSEAGQAELLADPPEDPEFEAEIARRSDSLHDGTAVLLTWEEAREQIVAELERRRAARAAGGRGEEPAA